MMRMLLLMSMLLLSLVLLMHVIDVVHVVVVATAHVGVAALLLPLIILPLLNGVVVDAFATNVVA